MKRTDLVLALVIGAFAAFVGVMVSHRPPSHSDRGPASVNAGTNRDTRADPPRASLAEDDYLATVKHVTSDNPPPARDLADIESRIAAATDSYMPQMLADVHGFLARWPDRRQQGLRVWVQSSNDAVHDWDDRYVQMARDAFDDWREGLPLRLDFVYDSASADIAVVWLQRFPATLGQRVGVTTRSVDQNGWFTAARIAIAIHDSAGAVIPPENLAGIMRHEAGHALGLGHSRDPKTKMFPVEMVTSVQPADRATMRLLYSIPPGAVRKP